MPGYDVDHGDCFASVVNSTEGASYPQRLTNNSVLWYWRKSMCRQMPLHFHQETKRGSFVGYEYRLRADAYDRLANRSGDCYRGYSKQLQSGLSDMSKCFFGKSKISHF